MLYYRNESLLTESVVELKDNPCRAILEFGCEVRKADIAGRYTSRNTDGVGRLMTKLGVSSSLPHREIR